MCDVNNLTNIEHSFLFILIFKLNLTFIFLAKLIILILTVIFTLLLMLSTI